MNELSLFSGAGGGLLATHHLLGWRTIGYTVTATFLATPTVKGDYNKKGLTSRSGDGLATSLKRAGNGGAVNPEWTAWFMGWPIGWTDLKPLATDRFRQWLNAFGGLSSADRG